MTIVSLLLLWMKCEKWDVVTRNPKKILECKSIFQTTESMPFSLIKVTNFISGSSKDTSLPHHNPIIHSSYRILLVVGP